MCQGLLRREKLDSGSAEDWQLQCSEFMRVLMPFTTPYDSLDVKTFVEGRTRADWIWQIICMPAGIQLPQMGVNGCEWV